MGWTVWGSNPGGERDFCTCPDRPTPSPVQRVPGLSGGKELLGRDADPSPPSSAVVKKE